MEPDEILNSIPDPGCWEEYARWFEMLERTASHEVAAELGPSLVSISGGDLALAADPRGRFGDQRFRRFLGAVLAADWLTYTAPDDRANLLRLGFVLDRFPAGFRVWFAASKGGWLPVGYSAWYPIDELTYQRFKTNHPPWRDRAVVPMTDTSEGDYLYLFNYSVLPAFRKGEGSRRLIRQLAAEVAPVGSRGMVAITVSDDGSRVATRFGLRFRHSIQVGASREEVWLSGQD